MKKAIVTIIYTLGTLIVFALMCIFLSHSRYVPFPDAMLPSQLWELAADWLALGTLPMAVASVLMREVHDTHGAKTALVYLPAAICTVALLFWISVWIMGMLRFPPSGI